MAVVVNPGLDRSVVSIYQKWSKEGTVVNRRQGHGRPRLIDAGGEQRLARVVRSNRQATVAQIAKEVNAGSDRKMQEINLMISSQASVQSAVRLELLLAKETQRNNGDSLDQLQKVVSLNPRNTKLLGP
ncbi:hypothetical protein QTP70_010398 [Hemibagrus guttatus]|uniref:Uncharacterized protein n=1 Tax=Hemibagrus guttatus TaxID=175788 RepID=A0AAE0UTI6_9TELE|nr:hypothetical protein QTP70_010398 [Hemibagrus guttatus]